MRLSQFFLPTLKETPSEAQIASHRLMLRAGMVRQLTAGIYSWLPLGHRVLKKIEQIVREEQDKIGFNELLMPTIQPAELWQESGRYDDYGLEMLRITDRHDRKMLFGPTNEEAITDIFRNDVRSYKQLPQMLYHIQWKFRDEIRPRFGVMRGREFLMKDAYSFDIDYESARHTYNKIFLAYCRTFTRLGVKAIPMVADTGPIGGDLSHEFIILADTGESEVFCDKKWLDKDLTGQGVDLNDRPGLENWVQTTLSDYAATEEKHDKANSPISGDDLIETRGIEVGHIFHFGTKYSEPMGATVLGPDGKDTPVQMGSYGIGVSRLVGALIEASHDENGIIWPESVAPYKVGLINLRTGDDACDAACEDAYAKMTNAGIEVLYDDRDIRAGGKFADMDLIGLPWQIVIGPKGLKNGVVELKNRRSGEKTEVTFEAALNQISA
ncbi:proline--tRNA ligase [Thalassospira lucentensis]|uniref:proline--tRNA ligase n=1 Tax=Thalassospira lucentensis TaxID=168935 RepID=UPI00142DCCE5|nr:proline--tRNA ligase [Thalassospira lucentensis]NIZ02112.1 proline--tRNA ligase [Thalassospira lucentensis]